MCSFQSSVRMVSSEYFSIIVVLAVYLQRYKYCLHLLNGNPFVHKICRLIPKTDLTLNGKEDCLYLTDDCCIFEYKGSVMISEENNHNEVNDNLGQYGKPVSFEEDRKRNFTQNNYFTMAVNRPGPVSAADCRKNQYVAGLGRPHILKKNQR